MYKTMSQKPMEFNLSRYLHAYLSLIYQSMPCTNLHYVYIIGMQLENRLTLLHFHDFTKIFIIFMDFFQASQMTCNSQTQGSWKISMMRHYLFFCFYRKIWKPKVTFNALSFWGSKMILYRPSHFSANLNCYIRVQFVFDQIKKLLQKSLIWTWSKRFGPDQNNFWPID